MPPKPSSSAVQLRAARQGWGKMGLIWRLRLGRAAMGRSPAVINTVRQRVGHQRTSEQHRPSPRPGAGAGPSPGNRRHLVSDSRPSRQRGGDGRASAGSVPVGWPHCQPQTTAPDRCTEPAPRTPSSPGGGAGGRRRPGGRAGAVAAARAGRPLVRQHEARMRAHQVGRRAGDGWHLPAPGSAMPRPARHSIAGQRRHQNRATGCCSHEQGRPLLPRCARGTAGRGAARGQAGRAAAMRARDGPVDQRLPGVAVGCRHARAGRPVATLNTARGGQPPGRRAASSRSAPADDGNAAARR